MIGLFNRIRGRKQSTHRSGLVGSTVGKSSVSGRDKILHQMVSHCQFESVIDVGCGEGDLFYYLADQNVTFKGTGVDMLDHGPDLANVDYIKGNLLSVDLDKKFDLIFSSHTIEHVADTETFLKKFFSLAKDDGHFCLIWPPPKDNIVGGHLHVFNMGLMLYNLVRIGVDCSQVRLYRSGYNLAILGAFKRFEVPELTYNRYELEALAPYFPFPVSHNFDGKVKRYVTSL